MLDDLPAEELARLTGLLRRRTYRPREVVLHIGDEEQTLHIVRRGRLKVLIPGDSGGEAVLSILGPGDIFGELALLDGGPRSATVVALDEVETAALSRKDFQDLLRSSPVIVERILVALAGKIRRLSEDMTNLMFLDLRGRLVRKLLELAESHGQPVDGGTEIDVALTQEELAAMIGATRPRVNKLLGFFEDRGAIAHRGRRLLILDPELLRDWGGG